MLGDLDTMGRRISLTGTCLRPCLPHLIKIRLRHHPKIPFLKQGFLSHPLGQEVGTRPRLLLSLLFLNKQLKVNTPRGRASGGFCPPFWELTLCGSRSLCTCFSFPFVLCLSNGRGFKHRCLYIAHAPPDPVSWDTRSLTHDFKSRPGLAESKTSFVLSWQSENTARRDRLQQAAREHEQRRSVRRRSSPYTTRPRRQEHGFPACTPRPLAGEPRPATHVLCAFRFHARELTVSHPPLSHSLRHEQVFSSLFPTLSSHSISAFPTAEYPAFPPPPQTVTNGPRVPAPVSWRRSGPRIVHPQKSAPVHARRRRDPEGLSDLPSNGEKSQSRHV